MIGEFHISLLGKMKVHLDIFKDSSLLMLL